MTELDRIPFASEEENPDQRTACVLLLDRSYSMEGAPIAALNEGLRRFEQSLKEDPLAARRVEVAVVTFGGGIEIQDFVSARNFTAPHLTASGDTPMGAAIQAGLDLTAQRKSWYRQRPLPYTRPWVFLLTDGAPTDTWGAAAARVHREEAGEHIAFFAVAVEGADVGVLRQIASPIRPPMKLAGLKFSDLFLWLSASLGLVAASTLGQQLALAPTDGWGTVRS